MSHALLPTTAFLCQEPGRGLPAGPAWEPRHQPTLTNSASACQVLMIDRTKRLVVVGVGVDKSGGQWAPVAPARTAQAQSF
jgi:hypothetical protein